MSNIVRAIFGGSKTTRTRRLWKIDKGMLLQFVDLNLPTAYQVHFANSPSSGQAKVVTATSDTVEIPYEYLQTGADVYAWIYLTPENGVGYTEYMVTIPVYARPDTTDEEPTPTQQSALDTAISALNSGVESVQAAVAGVQDSIDTALQVAKDSGEFDGPQGPQGVSGERGETGEPGPQGVPGTPGQDGVSPTATVTQTSTGATITVTDAEGTTTANIANGQDGAPGAPGTPGSDGFSPTITVTDITGGHRVTITDATGAHSFDVMNGEDGISDVTVGGYSVVHDGVAQVKVGNGLRTGNNDERAIMIADPNQSNIRTRSSSHVITPSLQHMSTFYGLAWVAGDTTQANSTTLGQYTESAKSAISEMLNGSVSVSGTALTINALPGIRYICGEVTTIDIVTPASGIIDVVFTSGSTPAVMTVTPPSGMTMRWANGFDPTSLEADTVYEVNIMDGCLGVAGTWT